MEIKFCKDCNHSLDLYEDDDKDGNNPEWCCNHENVLKDTELQLTFLVKGPGNYIMECQKVRADSSLCGMTGRWYEARGVKRVIAKSGA